ncbi:MAG: carbohydrate binding domain-containing protein, partial [ANME-2 cluster archaeon]|nr:carbohydrate binding domain-containing protein [ANME-2 cluster archaeon]
QLYQKEISLEPNTRYRLSFAAYSTTGHEVTVRLFKHVSPYTSYAPDFTVNLGTSWQTFTAEFTTTGFSSTVNDGRLQFWLSPFAAAGDNYYIDDVLLEKV